MKVSFKNITFYPTLDGKTPATDNFTPAIAEAVYQNAANFAEHKLAHRIAEAEDEIELSEQEVEVVKNAVRNFRFFIQKPILEALGVTFE